MRPTAGWENEMVGRPTGELRLRIEWETDRRLEVRKKVEAKMGWETGKKVEPKSGESRLKTKGNHTCFNQASFCSLLLTDFKLIKPPKKGERKVTNAAMCYSKFILLV